ncbi:tRNA (adenosine(37)-N6)-threonylcarbamoyltransferase complex transferase subunit TsaD [Flavobacteriaceae bacterium F08102]|nr:tRNA (adenosine(37)-N6)-threonylcarbamoyltransferase complex transferase subunit TsaD [Flavobacteriaceae bacterium F08102]
MDKNSIYILAIESSCDDTGVAILQNDNVLSNVVANQEIHTKYGGVVPELASRAHQQHIIPTIIEALKQANIDKSELSAIAFTEGPGLLGSLFVGSAFAKSMSMSLQIPLIGINHMQAHIMAHFIKEEGYTNPKFPFLCLTVSGGHTQIVKVSDYFSMTVIGETIDDAVGEAFDKSAKLLGFPYPGGPYIDKHAQLGNPKAYDFPHPKTKKVLDFSFSGLKTSVLYFLQRNLKENPNFIKENLNDICASIQDTIIQLLLKKLKRAADLHQINDIAIAGGVSANSGLRKALREAEQTFGWNTFIPKFEYTTDNAAMIGIVGYYKYLKQDFSPLSVSPKARLKL